jgi:hypothetical protein
MIYLFTYLMINFVYLLLVFVFLDTATGGPFNVNLTMGEMYLCAGVWFDNFHEKPAFGCALKTGADGSDEVRYEESESDDELGDNVGIDIDGDRVRGGKERVEKSSGADPDSPKGKNDRDKRDSPGKVNYKKWIKRCDFSLI